jgi:hypothetical protein
MIKQKTKTNSHSVVKWSSKEIAVKLIDPTPNNFKIKTDLGKERLQKSLELFGLAGNVVCNIGKNGRYPLIDGNSRVEQAKERGEKTIWVSLPNRPLTPTEYKEMAAMYDYAKAGEVDVERIHGELGTTSDFFKKWNIAVPKNLLDNIGKKGGVSIDVKVTDLPTGKNGKKKVDAEPDYTMRVELIFTPKEEAAFRKMEDKLAAKYKTENTADTVLAAFKALTK